MKIMKVRGVPFVILFLVLQLSPTYLGHSQAEGQAGIASIYSTDSGSMTASGQKLNPRALTAAHRKLPFGTKVHVTNKKNGRSVVVTINDRGPFVKGRIIDLTPAGAKVLGFSGLTQVTVNSVDSGRDRETPAPVPVAAAEAP